MKGDSFVPLFRKISPGDYTVVLGIDHFIYTEFVATLVPARIPGHIFWTYFAGIAQVGSGVCIALNLRLKLIGMLLGIMLFIWFVILYIPRAIADPYTDKGNEVTSGFEALSFSGIAFVIACKPWGKARRFRVGLVPVTSILFLFLLACFRL